MARSLPPRHRPHAVRRTRGLPPRKPRSRLPDLTPLPNAHLQRGFWLCYFAALAAAVTAGVFALQAFLS